MNNVPGWYELLLLALASFRLYRLIAEDTILNRPRRWLLRLGDWEEDSDDDPPEGYRYEWGIFLTCPWCLGWWLSLGVYLFWVWFPTEALIVCTPLVLSAIVGLTAKNLDRDEE